MICALNPRSMSVKKALHGVRNTEEERWLLNPHLSHCLNQCIAFYYQSYLSVCAKMCNYYHAWLKESLFSFPTETHFATSATGSFSPRWDWNVLETSFYSRVEKVSFQLRKSDIYSPGLSWSSQTVWSRCFKYNPRSVWYQKMTRDRMYITLCLLLQQFEQTKHVYLYPHYYLLNRAVLSKAESDQEEEKSWLLQTTFL